MTPLHRAAHLNHIEFAQLLVDEGHADIHKKTQVVNYIFNFPESCIFALGVLENDL